MTDAIIWADKLPDIIRKWVLVVPLILAITGMGTGGYHWWDKEKSVNKAVHEVAKGFQSAMTAPKQTRVIISSDCDGCIQRIETIEKKVNQLKRWH